jgi:hypothetical protein
VNWLHNTGAAHTTSTETDAMYDLNDIQPIFGREIAGNHTVHVTLEDGAVVCSCTTEQFGRVWFIGHDEHLTDWDLVGEAEAREIIAKYAPARRRRTRKVA